MRLEEFRSLVDAEKVVQVNFIESSCSPIVIEVEFEQEGEVKKALMKDDQGDVISVNCITKAYDICKQVGIREASLVQTIPHDEACVADWANYNRDAIPLKF